MKILHLTLKKKWFDMILSGEKKEEYRDLKPYWATRLIDSSEYPAESKEDLRVLPVDICFDILNGHNYERVLKGYFSKFKSFDAVAFKNGYSKNAREIMVECNGISFGKGKSEWGSTRPSFIISLGKISSTKNC